MVDAKVQLGQNRRAVIANLPVRDGNQRRRQIIRGLKAKLRDRIFRNRRNWLHPLQHLHARLRLTRLAGLGLKAIHKALDMRALLVLLALHRDLLLQLCAPRSIKRIIPAGIIGHLPIITVKDTLDRPVQQIAVVRDNQAGMGIAGQKVLQPNRPLQIEIVGRLIEQQQIRGGEQNRSQSNTHSPTAGKLATGPPLRRAVEPKPLQNRRGPCFRRMGLNIRKPGLDITDLIRIGLGLGPRQQIRALKISRQHGVKQADVTCGRFLRDPADACLTRDLDFPAIGGQFAADQLEQRGLTTAVSPDHTDGGSGRHSGRSIGEQRLSANREGKVLNGNHGRFIPHCNTVSMPFLTLLRSKQTRILENTDLASKDQQERARHDRF